MQTIVSIVEGDGEVVALPLLLRRLGAWLSPGVAVHVQRPFRVHRDQFLRRQDVFERHLQSAARLCGDHGWILILLDADDDCPRDLSADVLARAGQLIPHRRISVVLANREYEAWFLASADTLNGRHGLRLRPEKLPAAESVRGAKEWLSLRMKPGRYREITDQPAFSAAMDLQKAYDNSRSFRKLCGEWKKQIALLP